MAEVSTLLLDNPDEVKSNFVGIKEIKEEFFVKSGCEKILLEIFVPKDILKKVLRSPLEDDEKVFLINFIMETPDTFNYKVLSELYKIPHLKVKYIFEKLLDKEIIKFEKTNPLTNNQILKIYLENIEQKGDNNG